MTVWELMKELSKYDADMPVEYADPEAEVRSLCIESVVVEGGTVILE